MEALSNTRASHGLLHQLTALGISPRSLTWLTSYLSDRSITVRVGSTCSEHKAFSAGVPQGSHQGPVLFIIFINSLTHTVCIPTDIYADDTTLRHEHSPRAPACPSYQELQEAINCTEDWAESWHGKFRHAKTRIMSTSQDKLLQALTPTIDGQPIRIADNHRPSGVILSSNLLVQPSMQHATNSCEKSRFTSCYVQRPSTSRRNWALHLLRSPDNGVCLCCLAWLSP